MLKDGLYELHYSAGTGADAAGDSLLIALRSGRVLGSDRWGGLILGECVFDQATSLHHVKVELKVPPGGILVTESAPREDGGIITIDADLDDQTLRGCGVVDVGGLPVKIALQFKGSVPI